MSGHRSAAASGGPGGATVRVAVAADDAALAGLDAEAWTAQTGFPSVQARRDGSFFGPEHPPEDYLVAELDDAVVGYLRLAPWTTLPENAHVLGVLGVAVAPGARRRGVAGCLFAAAEREARRRGARKLSLRVLATNAPALQLYRRLGFRTEGRLRGEFVIDGREVDDLLLARRLD